jgi:hypothetical protein
VDPIHPIAPGPPAVSRSARLPVQPLERITRERDRPSRDRQQRRRPEPPPEPERGDDDGGHPHIDVRV